MYGRQSEIKRIQSRLQRIGQTNPHRPPLEEEKVASNGVRQAPQSSTIQAAATAATTIATTTIATTPISEPNESMEQSSHVSENETVGETEPVQEKAADIEPFISTSDRYKSLAGQQALREMGKIADVPEPLPGSVLFSPQASDYQSPWLSQVMRVDSETSQNSHQLAQSLRQHRYATVTEGYDNGYEDPTSLHAQNRPYSQNSLHPQNGLHAQNSLQPQDSLHAQNGLHAQDSLQPQNGLHPQNSLQPQNSLHPQRNSQHPWTLPQADGANHPQGLGDWVPANVASWQPSTRFTIAQGLVWLVGAMILRMGIDHLLEAFPHLWVVMAAMVLTPVAIALYQTAVNPQATVHSGRRLLVIMMGLLIGGQL